MQTAPTSIDAHIATFPTATQKLLIQLRSIINKAAPQATEKISYGIPTFYQDGNLVHFAGYKNHIGFYPGSSAIAEFEEELGKYELSKGTIQLPLDRNLPVTLLTNIVKFRVKANLEKAAKKKTSKRN